jgi:predicted lipid-binding transport protein (Tim44 family)
MNNQIVDIILFALVALFFVFQLWRVLGRRTGLERPPQLPPTTVMPRAAAPVLPFRRATQAPPQQPETGMDGGLRAIQAADPTFTPDGFLEGARHAFELIVKSYAGGDTATLRPLVSDEVYDTFAESIRERMAMKETVDTRVVRLQDPAIVDAGMEGRTALVTVKFVSGQTSVTRGPDNAILEGDPDRAEEHTDMWTFSRNTRSSDPNWILVGTGAPE